MRYVTLVFKCTFLLHGSHIYFIKLSILITMDWQHLYKRQLEKNRELEQKLDLAESILRNFLPIVEDIDSQN